MSRIETLKGFIAQRPADPFPQYGLALEYKNAGRLTEAVETFDALMEKHPTYTAAYLHAGARRAGPRRGRAGRLHARARGMRQGRRRPRARGDRGRARRAAFVLGVSQGVSQGVSGA